MLGLTSVVVEQPHVRERRRAETTHVERNVLQNGQENDKDDHLVHAAVQGRHGTRHGPCEGRQPGQLEKEHEVDPVQAVLELPKQADEQDNRGHADGRLVREHAPQVHHRHEDDHTSQHRALLQLVHAHLALPVARQSVERHKREEEQENVPDADGHRVRVSQDADVRARAADGVVDDGEHQTEGCHRAALVLLKLHHNHQDRDDEERCHRPSLLRGGVLAVLLRRHHHDHARKAEDCRQNHDGKLALDKLTDGTAAQALGSAALARHHQVVHHHEKQRDRDQEEPCLALGVLALPGRVRLDLAERLVRSNVEDSVHERKLETRQVAGDRGGQVHNGDHDRVRGVRLRAGHDNGLAGLVRVRDAGGRAEAARRPEEDGANQQENAEEDLCPQPHLAAGQTLQREGEDDKRKQRTGDGQAVRGDEPLGVPPEGVGEADRRVDDVEGKRQRHPEQLHAPLYVGKRVHRGDRQQEELVRTVAVDQRLGPDVPLLRGLRPLDDAAHQTEKDAGGRNVALPAAVANIAAALGALHRNVGRHSSDDANEVQIL
eukprot:Rhum_TRINITY_DN14319_c1_g1::Rhum_TRINITY_DN14319_c1_g1_i1::g.81645::m.81645